ncbi:MAG: sigma-70 family RNA polymerase sigma factor [Ferruginibacter sp.]
MDKKNYKDIDDQELLKLFYNDKNNEWLGILLQRYTLLLLGVCMKYLKNEEEAKDSVQQVFLKVISELHKYKVDYFKSWLYTIAKNYCLMRLRDKGKQPVEINENILAAPADDLRLTNAIEKDATLNNMEQALNKLNREQNICITLFYLEKKTYQQIVEETGYSVMQVKSNIQNGKRNLKIQMQRMQPDE